jgi:uncharacterized protein GlcG (DUF336 family)
MSITLAQAQQAVAAAIDASDKLKVKMNIAVVDAGANLIAFARQEGAWLGSIDIAIRKAKTARFFDMPTADLGKLSQPGQPLYGIEVTNTGLVSFGGGLPIMDKDGDIIGAIGVSGGSVPQDEKVAAAGRDALGKKK